MTENHTRSRIAMIREILTLRFPNAFFGKGQPKKPLAIGIGEHLALVMPEFGAVYIARTLSDYTGGPTYLRACVAGAERVNLQGDPDGMVLPEEEKHAAARLAGLMHKWSKQRPRLIVTETEDAEAC